MTSSGRDARKPGRSHASGPQQRAGAESADFRSCTHQPTVRLIGLAVLIHMLRSRRLYERIAVGAIVVAALRGLGQENRANALERLAAWNKRQVQILERRTKRHARRLERKAKRQARRLALRAS